MSGRASSKSERLSAGLRPPKYAAGTCSGYTSTLLGATTTSSGMPRRASFSCTDLSRWTTVGTAARHRLGVTAVSMYWYSKNQSCSPAMTREPSERGLTSPKNV